MILDNVEKPARYTGGELNSIIKQDAELNVALCFPDVYEVGMSHLGIQILYEVINSMDGVYAQRAFCPWVDMQQQMRSAHMPLCTLEMQQALHTFDLVGFNLSYEMCYSNVLAMLDLGGIPLCAADRADEHPIVVGGGACTVNPEPLHAFFDLFVIGEGEEVIVELCNLLRRHKKGAFNRAAFIRDAATLEGVYAPSLYTVSYKTDGTIEAITPHEGTPASIRRRFVDDFNNAQTISKPVLPYLGTVHDRCTLEIMRGCPNGCRFCQAGYYTRPVRERSAKNTVQSAKSVIAATGYDEISLCSLSSGDHSEIEPLIDTLVEEFRSQRVSVALPSMRANHFTLAKQLTQVRKTGFTFAPEAGTQRLRDVINKNITQDEILETVGRAFASGASTIKLYFMIGLPTEEMHDLDGIASLVRAIRDVFYTIPKQQRGGSLSIHVSASCFVPKPCTPFQWEPQDDIPTLQKKQLYLKDKLKQKGVRFNYHDAQTSFLEAVFARGDRRLSDVLLSSYQNGAKFDAWQEQFSFEHYQKAFDAHGVDPAFYANRRRECDEILPYSHIDGLISLDYLVREREKAYEAATTQECRTACSGCGMQQKGCKIAGGAL